MNGIDLAGAYQSGDWRQAGKRLPLYLGSGRFGGSFDAWGLTTPGHASGTATGLMHADHIETVSRYGYGSFVPLGFMQWEEIPEETPRHYRQQWLPMAGLLVTEWRTRDWGYRLQTNFHPDRPDVLLLEFEWENPVGAMPRLLWNFAATAADRCCLRAIALDGEAPKQARGTERIGYTFPRGTGVTAFVLEFGDSRPPPCEDPREFRRTAQCAWQRRLGALPDTTGYEPWRPRLIRYAHHLLASYGADRRSPAPPCGWSGNGWRNCFPMDLSFVHPALLRLGRADTARAWCEFYHGRIGQMREYTRRVFRRRGCMWAWEFPVGENPPHVMALEGQPNVCFYELHNAAYPAKTAWDTACWENDAQFTRSVAFPVIRESACFFADCLRREPDGSYGIYHELFSGQDEAAGAGGGNYLCALFAASWTLRAATAMAETLGIEDAGTAEWRGILNAGFNFRALLDPELGIYAVNDRFSARERLGLQKHPVQLNPYWSLPRPLTAADRRAWELRHRLCAAGGRCGWTRPVFLLGAAAMGDEALFRAELEALEQLGFGDPDGLQLDESPPDYMAEMEWARTPYYLTSEAMVLHAFYLVRQSPHP